MSLTSILNKEKDRKNLKNWFKHHFPTPVLPEAPILLVNSATDATYSAEIGTAFDYLFRFKLEHMNSSQSKASRWIAEAGLKRLMSFIESTIGKWMVVGVAESKIVDKKQFKASALNGFEKAKQHYEDFKQNGLVSGELIKSCVLLARLDSVFRANVIPIDFEHVPDNEVTELVSLLEAVSWSTFKSTQRCLLNPGFGTVAKIVGGADADLIIDNKLVDLKTTKFFKLERSDLNQLIGYYLLTVLAGQGEGLDELGIYFARFGFSLTLPLTTFYDMSVYPILAKQFSQLVADTDLNLVDGDELRKEQNLSRISWDFLDS